MKIMRQVKVGASNLIQTISPQFSTGKNQTTIGKHSHRILVTIPYFTGNYHS